MFISWKSKLYAKIFVAEKEKIGYCLLILEAVSPFSNDTVSGSRTWYPLISLHPPPPLPPICISLSSLPPHPILHFSISSSSTITSICGMRICRYRRLWEKSKPCRKKKKKQRKNFESAKTCTRIQFELEVGERVSLQRYAG